MDNTLIVLDILILVTIFLAGLWIKNYLPTYFNEKAKNLAQKEDIATITNLVEQVRASYTSELEKFKNSLQSDLERLKFELGKVSEAETKKREVYQEMVTAMGVFLSGRATNPEQKETFLSAYSTMWLWAPDNILKAINELLDSNTLSLNPLGLDQEKIKQAYANCVLTMRKDAAHPDTKLNYDDHRFVSF